MRWREEFDSTRYLVTETVCRVLLAGRTIEVGTLRATATGLERSHLLVSERILEGDAFDVANRLIRECGPSKVWGALNKMRLRSLPSEAMMSEPQS